MSRKITKEKPIDIVIAWVDGSDRDWLEEKKKHLQDVIDDSMDVSESRYRDWDNLQYLFRGIEKFAPWVNKVHLVTWGHIPNWLNTEYEKINIIKHIDYLPEQYLPTFSSRTIELNFHRINDLSEKFIYFNDDMFLTSPVSPDDFFNNNQPIYEGFMRLHSSGSFDSIMPYTVLNTTGLINDHFSMKEVLHNNFSKWFNLRYPLRKNIDNYFYSTFNSFPGFDYNHLPTPFRKKDFIKIWENNFERLNKACKDKFRTKNGFNQYLIQDWVRAEGNFYPRHYSKMGRVFFNIDKELPKIIKELQRPRHKLVCINDDDHCTDFEDKKRQVNNLLARLLPDKSDYEA